MKWLEYINPLTHFTHGEYVSFWDALFRTTLAGFWPRVAFAGSIFAAFWFGMRRQNWPAARALLIIAAVMAYGASILMALGLM